MPVNSQPAAASILVVDDEPDLRTLYELTLLREGYRVETAASVGEAREQLQTQRCVVMTAYGSAENAVEALRSGAFDYLTKPVDLKQFRLVVASAAQGVGAVPPPGAAPARSPAAAPGAGPVLSGSGALDAMVGDSPAMQAVKQRIAKVARGMAPVLVHGESGTGKELVARALHACSQRASGPLVAVNCGAIPENLLEAEFFGARKGSYTGATQDRDGYFQAARGGTLFLDEIGDLPLPMQAKLLRAIQERRVRALGSTQEEAADVRIVSATHRDLAADVQQGRFRQDLYYRLNVIEVLLPPLRERREDLPALCRALLARLSQESGLPLPEIDALTLEQIARLPLSGNVRELENLLHRAITLGEDGPLRIDPDMQLPCGTPPAPPTPAPLHPAAQDRHLPPEPADDGLPRDLQAWLDERERGILVQALQENGFNRTATAARLGLSLRQIRYRIERLNIALPGDAGAEAEGSGHGES
jgi:two-component system response regulator PilR (NtrC family)